MCSISFNGDHSKHYSKKKSSETKETNARGLATYVYFSICSIYDTLFVAFAPPTRFEVGVPSPLLSFPSTHHPSPRYEDGKLVALRATGRG